MKLKFKRLNTFIELRGFYDLGTEDEPKGCRYRLFGYSISTPTRHINGSIYFRLPKIVWFNQIHLRR